MMRNVSIRILLPLVALVALGSCHSYPTRPAIGYHEPVISSVTVFPTVIGQGDSALITVVASDADGDSLVYDWETDARLVIKDAPRGYLFGTRSNSHVFYHAALPDSGDTVWVECSVRDGRGGSAFRQVYIRTKS